MDNKQKQMKYLKRFKTGGRILELGSGGGDFLSLCAENGLDATGVDTHPNCPPGVKVIKKEIVAYLKGERAGKYDGIYARHIIEHFEEKRLRRLLKNSNRLLKKGGIFIAIFPNVKNIHVATTEFWKDKTHVKPYSAAEAADMLEAAGFTILEQGPDRESWDNSVLKNILRAVRGLLAGVKNQPPDYFVIAVK
ncbi:MAG: class I SAM-dependent methyltransferase [Spirochaetia bacterium]|nr:class I SAM-dependent methyltransferase [Spirochaetia bacterium]